MLETYVYLRQDKDNGNKGDPEECPDRNWVRKAAKVERPSNKFVSIDHP